MSDSLALEQEVARLRHLREEADKFNAEQRRLTAEQNKLAAEQLKLTYEALKLDRDRFWSPWLAVAAICGGIGGTIAGLGTILRFAGLAH